MTVKIDKNICNGCPGRKEGLCERICPGNLIKRSRGKAEINKPGECWDCAACVKACPLNAIKLYLPATIGGQGGEMSARLKGKEIIWKFQGVETDKEYKVNR